MHRDSTSRCHAPGLFAQVRGRFTLRRRSYSARTAEARLAAVLVGGSRIARGAGHPDQERLMPYMPPFHTSEKEEQAVYHNNSACADGRRIKREHICSGEGQRRRLCEAMSQLGDQCGRSDGT